MISGIYKITNRVNGKFYLGRSKDIEKRKSQHFHALMSESREHINNHLQNAFNKYGRDAFVFEVIELVDESNAVEREQYYLDTLTPWDQTIGYNISRSAKGGSVSGEEHPGSLLTEDQVAEIKINLMTGEKHRDISERYEVTIGTISLIWRGERWNGVRDPEGWDNRELRGRISEEFRKQIEQLMIEGVGDTQITRDLSVDRKTCWCIRNRKKAYAHLPPIQNLPERKRKKRVSLSDQQVIEIFHAGGSQRFLAAQYGVSQKTINNIKNQKGRWARLA